MVFRLKSPLRIMEEGGLSKRSKFLLLVFALAFLVMGFYFISSSRENKRLFLKDEGLALKLGKYITAYQQCERNLKTAREDVANFHESNKALQSKLMKQESELAGLEKNNLATESKLQDAFNFFLEVKELVGNDQTLSEYHEVTAEVASPLKKDISTLKESYLALGKLQETHKATLEKLDAANAETLRVQSEKRESERRRTILAIDIHKVQRQLTMKDEMVAQMNRTNVGLSRTVKKLKGMIRKMTKRSKLSSEKLKVSKRAKPDDVSTSSQATKTGNTDSVAKSGLLQEAPRFLQGKQERMMERRVVETQAIEPPPPQQPTEINKEIHTTQTLVNAPVVIQPESAAQRPDNDDNNEEFGDTQEELEDEEQT